MALGFGQKFATNSLFSGRVERNDIVTQYDYDEADRLTSVVKRGTVTYCLNPWRSTDFARPLLLAAGEIKGVGSRCFSQRLVSEIRTGYGTASYSLYYDYDAGGNRIWKYDEISGLYTEYTYDTQDPHLYQ